MKDIKLSTLFMKKAYIVLLAFALSFSIASVGFACDGGCYPTAGTETNEEDNPEDPECEKAGQPISAYSGKETHQVLDLEVKGVFPIRMIRKYDSQSRYDSPVGYGWSFLNDKRLFKYSDGSIVVRTDCGTRKKYLFTGGAYQSPININHSLVENGDGTFTLTKVNGSKEEYDLEGKLSALVDPQGNYLEFIYDPAGRLPLTGSSPYSLDPETPTVVAFDYRLTEIKERLADGTFSGNSVTLTYDQTTGRLDQITSSDARTAIYVHDTTQSSKNGNLLQADVEGIIYTYDYNDLNGSVLQDAHNLTSIQKGQNTTPYVNTYDAQDRVQQQDYGFDTYSFTYTVPGLQTDVTHTTRSYDGSVVLSTLTEKHIFDIDGFPIEKTQTLDDGTQYRFVQIRNSDAKVERAEYYETPAGGTETLERAFDYTYDTSGNRLTKVVTLDSGEIITTTWTHDNNWVESEDTVSSLASSRHFRTEFTFYYDGNGKPTNIREEKRRLEGGGFLTTTYTYDNNGRPQTTVLPDGHTLVNEYTGYYLSKIYHQIGGVESPYLSRQFGYDAQGNRNLVTDAKGNAIQLTYDSKDRLATQTNALAEQRVLTYDNSQYNGRYLTNIEVGNTVADGVGHETRLSYTPQGWIEKIERKNNSGVWETYATFGYDSSGNRISSTEYRDANSFTTLFTYDGLGRQISSTDPVGNTTATSYDMFNNPIVTTDGKNRDALYQYDDLGRIISIEQQGVTPAAVTTMTYDAGGNLLTVTDAESKTTSYQYDLLGRRTAVIQPLGQTVSTTYDVRDRVDTVINARGHKTVYQYFDWGGIDTIQYFDTASSTSPTRTVSYTYDFNGNIESVTDNNIQAPPVYQYTYDPLNRTDTTTVNYITGQSITIDDDHDRYGNRERLRLADGVTNDYIYLYDKKNQLQNITLPGNNIVGLSYYDNSAYLKQISFPNGVTSDYQYKDNGPVGNAITQNSSLAILEQRDYTYDGMLNMLTQTSSRDGGTYSYDYDGLDHLVQAIPPLATGLAQEDYIYDRVGNREVPGDPTQYQYDNNHRISQSPSISSYNFDDDGNLLSRSDGASFTYNKDNRLTQHTDGSIVASYIYDSFGRRIQKTVDGVSTWFVWDQDRLLAEYDNNGNRTTLYGYLDGQFGGNSNQIISIQKTVTTLSVESYFVHNDHLGTPKYITDSSEVIVWSQVQTAFGVAIVDEDPDANSEALEFNMRFAGQYHDSESGLHYNYFRDYDPSIGRYIQSDPIGLDGGINTYAYVGGNPINSIDPLGLVRWKVIDGIQGSAALGIGGSFLWYKLESKCIDGEKTIVNVLAGGMAAGGGASCKVCFGSPVRVPFGLEFEDRQTGAPNPGVFDGGFLSVNATAQILGLGGSVGGTVLGLAISTNPSGSLGFGTLGAEAIGAIGSSRFIDSETVPCPCD